MIKQNINYNDSLSKKNLFSRWILLFFIIIIYFFINQFKLIDPSDQSELVFFLCILLFAGFNYYLTILKKNGEIQKIQIFIIIAFDFVFATFVMLSVGRENSPFFIQRDDKRPCKACHNICAGIDFVYCNCVP